MGGLVGPDRTPQRKLESPSFQSSRITPRPLLANWKPLFLFPVNQQPSSPLLDEEKQVLPVPKTVLRYGASDPPTNPCGRTRVCLSSWSSPKTIPAAASKSKGLRPGISSIEKGLSLARVVHGGAVPAQLGVLTDTFQEHNLDAVWLELGLLILYKLLQGPSGLLGSIRSILWVHVFQHTYRALTTAAFEHGHSLSLDFHLGKLTGEVLSALNKGASIKQFLEQVHFQVVLMLVDLLVAIIYFYIRFGAMYALFVWVTYGINYMNM